MITFKQYLNESRTKAISVQELMKWADANASSYLKGSHFLYRGAAHSGPELAIGDSTTSSPRASANTNNNYTLWMDNHPAFKGWPKRSQSWIATDDVHTASGFGNILIMIVADNAKIGLVKHDDLWHVPIAGKMQINTWNDIMEEVLEVFKKNNNKTYDALREGLAYVTASRLEEHILKMDDNDDMSAIEKIILDEMEQVYHLMVDENCDNLYELWDKLFAPSLFEKTTGAEISSSPAMGEVWIEGVCGFVPNSGNGMSEEDKMVMHQWAMKKYPKFAEYLVRGWEDHDELEEYE